MKEGSKKVKLRAVLVFGAPASGKTTFSERFMDRFHAAYFDMGAVAKKYNLSNKMILIIIEQLAKTKRTLVIEGCLGTEKERKAMRNVLRRCGYTPSLIWVQTDVGTIKSRLKNRTMDIALAKQEYTEGIAKMEAPTDTEKPIVISGKHTFETQLRQVLAQLA